MDTKEKKGDSSIPLSRLGDKEIANILKYCDRKTNTRFGTTNSRVYAESVKNKYWKYFIKKGLMKQAAQSAEQHEMQLIELPDFSNFDEEGKDFKQKYIDCLKILPEVQRRDMIKNKLKKSQMYRETVLKKVANLLVQVLFGLIVLAIIVTSILSALYFDNIIPNESMDPNLPSPAPILYKPYWLIPFSFAGFVVTPFWIFTIFFMFISRGWTPYLTFVLKRVKCIPKKYRICQYFTAQVPKDMRYMKMKIFIYSAWIPLLVILFAIKLAFFRFHSIWSYLLLPIWACWIFIVIDALYSVVKVIKNDHAELKAPLIFIYCTSVIVKLLLAASTIVSALKADGLTVLQGVPYWLLFLGYYVGMFLLIIDVIAIVYAYRTHYKYLPLCDIRSIRLLLIISIIVVILFLPFIAFIVLLSLRLEGLFIIKYSWIFGSIPIGIGSIGIAVVAILYFTHVVPFLCLCFCWRGPRTGL